MLQLSQTKDTRNLTYNCHQKPDMSQLMFAPGNTKVNRQNTQCMCTSLERQQLVKQDVPGIRAVVHQVQFSDDGDGSVA